MSHSLPVSRCSRVVVSMPFVKATSFVLVGLSLLCLSGCSTIVNGKHQALTIESNPSGAAFQVEGVTGVTPGTVSLERAKTNHTIVIHKPGFQQEELKVGRKLNPWVFGNLLFIHPVLIVVSSVTDFITGGSYALQTDHVQANLRPEYGVPAESPTPQISAKDSPSSESVAKSE